MGLLASKICDLENKQDGTTAKPKPVDTNRPTEDSSQAPVPEGPKKVSMKDFEMIKVGSSST